ncbi:aldo/keto reductase [Polyangium mundeleinium]|uniref:Aldo/keto reductase n=1 Tax=Polyangium mundeleinium TaxID=2995306 RepID=A0ABT5ELD6_9BACT|nr:aldo/keto reductase [Polyangium mundeleinium]MDC0742658.1 aldo/keto reductase [Polyangium mundeleinium]
MNTALKAPSSTFRLGGDLPVRRLGYGAMYLTGPGMWGPPTDPDAAIRLLRRAVDLGVNFIDTADSYGPDANEQIIRRALHPYPAGLVITTKGGLLRSGPEDWTRRDQPYIVPCGRPAYLRQQVEMSLRNLGLERIELYQLHRIDPAVPLADQLGELVRLREQGKIRHIALSGQPEVSIEQLEKALAITEIVAVENLYNVADRAGEPVLRYCEERGIAFIPWFPMGHGALAGPGSILAGFARKRSLTPAQLALAWLLHKSPAILAIPGTSSLTHLEENLRAAQIKLDEKEMSEIADIAASVPTWRPTPPAESPTQEKS